jgi:hypothetical protein
MGWAYFGAPTIISKNKHAKWRMHMIKHTNTGVTTWREGEKLGPEIAGVAQKRKHMALAQQHCQHNSDRRGNR